MDNNTTEKQKDEPIKPGIKIFLILLLICFLLFPITRCTLNPLCKDATENDITINYQENFSTSMKYTIVPKKNILNLEIKFMFYDKNHKLLEYEIKEIGNVKESIQYDITINLLYFSPSKILEINECSIEVTGKTGISNIWSTTTVALYYVFGNFIYIVILLLILPPSKNNKKKGDIRIS